MPLIVRWQLALDRGQLTVREIFTLATIHGLVSANNEGGFAQELVHMLNGDETAETA